ncbi:alpha/beta hydrolase [Abyssalbus ytuae]|uniref:Alpha/beta hydrolase-fold protein n=1 Tax=Abyssalbus ytuae TaxID=2926907 RepID=A0A9E7CTT4_9FLAO|nr:alpha/beta hydrolase-fold protein [Abyssalbus ytuae]UOB18656.1 alpha/beta hydrolase-fold protein [Abyssalbus ytuae]
MNKLFLIFLILITTISCKNENLKSESLNKGPLYKNTEELDKSATDTKEFKIKGTEVHQIKSSINQKAYDLYVKLPKSYSKTDKKFPILILSDSDYSFPLVTSINRRLNVEEYILIGISYSKGDKSTISRTRDYTPTYSPNEPRGHSKEARLASGKADNFIAFIKNDVFRFLENKYRVDMTKKVFAGHSFGGLLASYMLVTTPDLFEYYLSGSPSLWYDNHCINKFEDEYFKTKPNLKANFFMCIGADEETKTGSKMVTEMLEFKERLLSRNYKDLNIKSIVIADEDHQTVYPSFITKGIIWAFGQE